MDAYGQIKSRKNTKTSSSRNKKPSSKPKTTSSRSKPADPQRAEERRRKEEKGGQHRSSNATEKRSGGSKSSSRSKPESKSDKPPRSSRRHDSDKLESRSSKLKTSSSSGSGQAKSSLRSSSKDDVRRSKPKPERKPKSRTDQLRQESTSSRKSVASSRASSSRSARSSGHSRSLPKPPEGASRPTSSRASSQLTTKTPTQQDLSSKIDQMTTSRDDPEKPEAEDAAEDSYDDDFDDYDEDFESGSDASGTSDENDDDDSGLRDQEGQDSGEQHDSADTAPPDRDAAPELLNIEYAAPKPAPPVDPEMAEVLAAMQAENARAQARPSTRAAARPVTRAETRLTTASGPTRSSALATSIKATGPSKRVLDLQRRARSNAALGKAAKRYKALSKLVTLDTSSFTILDLAPCTEYELYIRSFGKSGHQQVAVQCSAESLEAECQTESITNATRWTQYPPQDLKGVGVDGGSQTNDEDDDASRLGLADLSGLDEFLTKASRVVLTLLREDAVHTASGAVGDGVALEPSALPVCRSFQRIASTAALFAGRYVTAMQGSASNPHTLLTMFSPPPSARSKDVLKTVGMLCVWDITRPSLPTHVLVCHGQPTCCTFANAAATAVLAGTEEGVIMAWDLLDPADSHKCRTSTPAKQLLRFPSFIADFTTANTSHDCRVVSIASLHATAEAVSDDGAFQAVSMDESGLAISWTGLYLPEADMAGSLTDIGMFPGSRLKLIDGGATRLAEPDRQNSNSIFTYMTLDPQSPNHIYAGTSMGTVVHRVRNGNLVGPKAYVARIHSLAPCPANCTAIAFHPDDHRHFLAGFDSGHIVLFKTNHPAPLRQWTVSAAVSDVLWSLTRPAVFAVLTADSVLHYWDLLSLESGPLETHALAERDGQNKKALTVRSIQLLPHSRSTSTRLAFSTHAGAVELHTFEDNWCRRQPNEMQDVLAFFNSQI
eukprot:TRINITY_DN10876_c0_g1_i7.p1 TRINITY_DN10876_c0_g1~~TRINITY_DN10876_c0_g1_i7.p1  ORF type:complete len:948 (+),score=153.77 TRINITY_DN10876_c0_g1_i7:80-2923(+)